MKGSGSATLVNDMTAFLRRLPNNTLLGIQLTAFTNKHPEHRGTFKLKKLALQHSCFRWVGSSASTHGIALARGGAKAPARVMADKSSALVKDMVAFLRTQPNGLLSCVQLKSFYELYPQHKGTFKVKKLAQQHDCFCWLQGQAPGENFIVLAASQRRSSQPWAQDLERSAQGDLPLTLMRDMVAFLQNQPTKSLLGSELPRFIALYPQHEGRCELKALAESWESIFRWHPIQNSICLASEPHEYAEPPLQIPGMIREPELETPAEPLFPGSAQFSTAGCAHDSRVVHVESAEMLAWVTSSAPFEGATFSESTTASPELEPVAIRCIIAAADSIAHLEVATLDTTWVFDCSKLDPATVCQALQPLLEDPRRVKLFHDLCKDAFALGSIGGPVRLHGTFDTQLAMEVLSGELRMGFQETLARLGLGAKPTKPGKPLGAGQRTASPRPGACCGHLQEPSHEAAMLIRAKEKLDEALDPVQWLTVQSASDDRASIAQKTGGARHVWFDETEGFAMTSFELLLNLKQHNGVVPFDLLLPSPLKVSDDTQVLLDMLPGDIAQALATRTDRLSDIVMDKGRRPHAWIDGVRVFLADQCDRLINEDDIDVVVGRVGGFGADNRAGIERQLHRISAMRNRSGAIIGLTMRVGRHVTGNADMISDLLFADPSRSILFLGEPGSGKTTVVREVTRLLAEKANVCIVDTSNEIAGDGDVPHPCVGHARRLMVPCLNQQAEVMIECVQNHTPNTIVIDEIGRSTEVEAARTCKQRGVRLIASAHGDLRKLVKNPKLRGLVGGVERVTIGDQQAKLEQKQRSAGSRTSEVDGGSVSKVKALRAGSPTFDIIVELRREAQHEWRVVLDVAEAVDKILAGDQFNAQLRTRDPKSGAMQIEMETA